MKSVFYQFRCKVKNLQSLIQVSRSTQRNYSKLKWTQFRHKDSKNKFIPVLNSYLPLFSQDYHGKYFDYVKSSQLTFIFGFLYAMMFLIFGIEEASCDGEEDFDETNHCDSENMCSKNPIILETLPISSQSMNSHLNLKEAINSSKQLLKRRMMEAGAPGLSVAVAVDGKIVWSEGFGASDVENSVPMTPQTVLRIASISKSLTSVAVFQLIEEGKLDLDAAVQIYVPSFPQKFYDGEPVKITTRHLMTHTSGIRHYKLAKTDSEDKEKREKESSIEVNEDLNSCPTDPKEKLEAMRQFLSHKSLRKRKEKTEDEFLLPEYFIKEGFDDVTDALRLFQDDELFFKPGTSCSYSTHAWTLVSAVVEGASGKSFTNFMEKLFRDLGMKNTYLDKAEPIIYKRSRCYFRDDIGRLKNSPYVDNSYKWAGGGILSTVLDLVGFGNAMLYSFQNVHNKEPNGFLKPSSLREMWSGTPKTKCWGADGNFGLGWGVVEEDEFPKAFAGRRAFYASHTGGAIGASSVLLIKPGKPDHKSGLESPGTIPKGVVVAVIANMQNVALYLTAQKVAELFQKVKVEAKVVGAIGKNKVFAVDATDEC